MNFSRIPIEYIEKMFAGWDKQSYSWLFFFLAVHIICRLMGQDQHHAEFGPGRGEFEEPNRFSEPGRRFWLLQQQVRHPAGEVHHPAGQRGQFQFRFQSWSLLSFPVCLSVKWDCVVFKMGFLHNRVNDLQFLTRILKFQRILLTKKRDENDVHRNIGFRLFVHHFRLVFWSIKSFEMGFLFPFSRQLSDAVTWPFLNSRYHVKNDEILHISWGKHSLISILWRKTFSFSCLALFFSRSCKEDNQVVFCMVGKRLRKLDVSADGLAVHM